MKTEKITAKLRGAVPVCFVAEGKEVKRYKNIDLLDMQITFEIDYAPGVLPEIFPEPRPKITRAEKTAAKAAVKPEPTAEKMPRRPCRAETCKTLPYALPD